MKAVGRHSYIAFYPTNWSEGTARLPRLHRSVLFDICLYIWDRAQPMPAAEVRVALLDLPDGRAIVDDLVAMGKLEVLEDGSLVHRRALAEAERAFDLWQRKSEGGTKGGKARSATRTPSRTPSGTGSGTPPVSPSTEPKNLRTGEGISPSADAEEEHTQRASASAGAQRVLDAWNAMAKVAKLSLAPKLLANRERHAKLRIAEHGEDEIIRAFGTIPASAFLMGRTGGTWQANFDDLMRPANMGKLVSGGYHTPKERASIDRAAAAPPPRPKPQAALFDDTDPNIFNRTRMGPGTRDGG